MEKRARVQPLFPFCRTSLEYLWVSRYLSSVSVYVRVVYVTTVSDFSVPYVQGNVLGEFSTFSLSNSLLGARDSRIDCR